MKKFILYDGRAVSMGTQEASIYSMADSLKEINKDAKDYCDGAIYSYDDVNSELTNETLVRVIN